MNNTLETRLCACGCGLSFRCLPESPNHFALWQHAELALRSKDARVKALAKAYFAERTARRMKRPRPQGNKTWEAWGYGREKDPEPS